MKRIGSSFGLFLLFAAVGWRSYPRKTAPQTSDVDQSRAAAALPATAPWFFATVDSPNDVGQHVSVAFDPETDIPYISYYDAANGDLRMATYVGTSGDCGPADDWTCETVDSVGDVGQYSAIAVDPTDNLPIIAYFDATNGALKLAIGSGTGWIYKTIHDPSLGPTAGMFASLELDTSGKTHIAYYYSSVMGDDSLWYAEYVGGGAGNCTDDDYQCDLIHSGDRVGKYASLALDSSDQPRIAYYDQGNDALRFAFNDSSGWILRLILPSEAGMYASLVVDTNNGDLAHIAHYNATNGTLEYAVFVGPGGNCGLNEISLTLEWQCDEIQTMGTGTDPRGISMAVDAQSFPVIAYQSGGSVLKVARPVQAIDQFIGNCGPVSTFFTWQCDSLSLGVSISQGDYLSLAVNSTGLATLAYYGDSLTADGDLKIAYQRLQLFLPAARKDG